jgi:alkanesulfonate monooxygenase SsuD/methylene tetrahydromethanopterin reductase-like flavin-dependent oxidoreductase (luciferase family)
MKKRIEKKSGALQIIDLTEEKAKRYTENPKEIPEDYLQRMAICGTADDCLDRINELRKIGITGVAHRYPTEQTIRGVSEALLPSLFATA